MTDTPNLEDLNQTELLQLIWNNTGLRLKRSLQPSRLIEIIEKGLNPEESEIAETLFSRRRLENWIAKHWDYVNSQLPCKGINRGKCTIYGCPEGRHVDCFISNKHQLL